MAEVDQGVEQHQKTDGSNIIFKARKMKDEGKDGFNVGINNIADFGDMETTTEVSMTDTQKPLNFFANFVRNAVIDEGSIADDEREEDDKEKKLDRKKGRKGKNSLDRSCNRS
ncbi:hypothetical protein [Parapedobacter pyrenivorans]|nr:hypothetical protein [Parapedobacter pyrenivorans]